MTGIYMILCRLSGGFYIGSTAKGFESRWSVHRNYLRAGNHHSRYLQHAWNKYGEETFSFLVLEVVAPEKCLSTEQGWLDDLRPRYNMRPNATSNLGFKHSDDTKRKWSETRRGSGNGMYGAKHSAETRARISAAKKGKPVKGRPHSEEAKEKMRRNALGRKASPEVRAKMSASHKARRARTEQEESA